MFNWLWRLLGYRRIILIDRDGEVTKSWALKTASGFIANRHGWMFPVLLSMDGTIKHGPSYVVNWMPHDFIDGFTPATLSKGPP